MNKDDRSGIKELSPEHIKAKNIEPLFSMKTDDESIDLGKSKLFSSVYQKGDRFRFDDMGFLETVTDMGVLKRKYSPEERAKLEEDGILDMMFKDRVLDKNYKSRSLEYYNPLSEKDLYRDFMGIGNDKDIIRYVNKYGNLLALDSKKDLDPIYQNEKECIMSHVTAMKKCRQAIRLFKENCLNQEDDICIKHLSDKDMFDMFSLEAFPMINNPYCVDCIYNKKYKEILGLFYEGNVYKLWDKDSVGWALSCDVTPSKYTENKIFKEKPDTAEPYSDLRKYKLPSLTTIQHYGVEDDKENYCNLMLEHVQKCVNANLSKLSFKFKFNKSGMLTPQLDGYRLIEYIWFAFASDYSLHFNTCKTCGEVFMTSHEDAEYCPPKLGKHYSSCYPSSIKKVKK